MPSVPLAVLFVVLLGGGLSLARWLGVLGVHTRWSRGRQAPQEDAALSGPAAGTPTGRSPAVHGGPLPSHHGSATRARRRVRTKAERPLVVPAIVLGLVLMGSSCSSCQSSASPGEGGKLELPPEPALNVFFVQGAFHHLDSGTTHTLKFQKDVHFPHLIVVAITTAQMPVRTLTDTFNDVYTRVGQPLDVPPPDQRNPVHVELWYAVGAAGALTVTVSFASPPANAPPDSDVGIYEFGIDSANQSLHFEKTVAAVGFDNQPEAGRLQSSLANQAEIYFVVGSDGGPAPGTGSGKTPVKAGKDYTLLDHQDEPDFVRFYTEFQIATGATNTAFLISYSSNWCDIGAVFSPR